MEVFKVSMPFLPLLVVVEGLMMNVQNEALFILFIDVTNRQFQNARLVELCTLEIGCSKGSLEDKILVSVPDSSERPLKIEKFCLDCEDPVHGLYCRQCALIRKTLEEVFQDFQDTSSLDDDI
ncbi:hypothetical protein Tco_0502216 [Tanacetum coccineum]